MTVILRKVYERLSGEFGPQHWWPAQSPLEVIVGAVLTQNTAWRNVAWAIDNLREAGVLSLPGLRELPQADLEQLIRPAGYFRLKARRLRNVIDFIFDRYEGSLSAMFAVELAMLREELLSINGVGPETADSILLYAGNLPTFVVDAYTKRLLVRHGWIEAEADYHQVQQHFTDRLAVDAPLFNEFHALIVRVGNQYCRKVAKCEACPLRDMLPDGGAIAP